MSKKKSDHLGRSRLCSVGSPFLAEDVAIEGWVLALLSVSHLIDWVLHWVHHTGASASHYSRKLRAMCHLCGARFGGASSVDSSVILFGSSAMCKANFVFFCDFAVDLVHWECVFYFCHSFVRFSSQNRPLACARC